MVDRYKYDIVVRKRSHLLDRFIPNTSSDLCSVAMTDWQQAASFELVLLRNGLMSHVRVETMRDE